MPRNGSGNYSPPTNHNPVISGTVIEAEGYNATVDDMSAGISGSLPRNGEAPMTGPLRLAEGSVGAPAIAFNADSSTGLFRPATNTLAIAAGGAEQVRFTAGNLLLGTTANSGEKLQVTGASKLVGPVNITGATTITGATIISGVTTATGGLISHASNTARPFQTVNNEVPGGAVQFYISHNGDKVDIANARSAGGIQLFGNAATASNVPYTGITGVPTRLNWVGTAAPDFIAGQLVWKNFGNGHTIFDASAGTSPTGTAVNKRNSQTAWSESYPSLMGWNGSETYGVRVDSSRVADYAASAGNANTATTAGTATSLVSNPTLNGTTYIGRTLADNGSVSAPAYSFKNDTDTGIYSGGDGDLSFTVNGVRRGGFDSAGNLGIQAAYFGNGGGLTGFAPSLTSGTTDNLSTTATNRRYNWGVQAFISNKGNNAYLSNTNDYTQFVSTDAGAAAFSFHRTSGFAVNMGLDPDNVIRIGGWSAAANRFQFDMGGNFTAAGNVAAFSDARLKKNWVNAPEGFVEKWATIQSGTYDRVDQECTQVGVVAQDVQAILPHAVTEDKDGMLSLNYGGAAAVATVELAKEVVELKKLVQDQSKLIAMLMEKLK